MDTDGSNPKQLTESGNNPHATADWVVYQANRRLWRVPIDGGERVQLGENMFGAIISPDGKLLACSLQMPGSVPRLAIIPIEGGTPVKMFDVDFAMPARIRWRHDGRAVTYVGRQNGIPEIWSQPIDGGESKKLTNFKSDRIFSFDWSRDNRLVISHGSATSDVVLISNIE
jgi:hypothetical protein